MSRREVARTLFCGSSHIISLLTSVSYKCLQRILTSSIIFCAVLSIILYQTYPPGPTTSIFTHCTANNLKILHINKTLVQGRTSYCNYCQWFVIWIIHRLSQVAQIHSISWIKNVLSCACQNTHFKPHLLLFAALIELLGNTIVRVVHLVYKPLSLFTMGLNTRHKNFMEYSKPYLFSGWDFQAFRYSYLQLNCTKSGYNQFWTQYQCSWIAELWSPTDFKYARLIQVPLHI